MLSISTHSLTLLLHNLANLHARIEELGCATIQADGLALVKLALAVIGRNALLLARSLKTASNRISTESAVEKEVPLPVVGVGHHAHLALDGGDLLLRGRLLTTHSEERHIGDWGVGWVIGVCGCGC